MPHTSNDPVVTQTDAFAIIGEACRPVAVQNETLKYRDKSAGNSSTEPRVLDKPYVTARRAAELLGCDERVVVDDIRHGTAGSLSALIGGEVSPGQWWASSWQFEPPHLERHRKRLAPDSSVVKGQ